MCHRTRKRRHHETVLIVKKEASRNFGPRSGNWSRPWSPMLWFSRWWVETLDSTRYFDSSPRCALIHRTIKAAGRKSQQSPRIAVSVCGSDGQQRSRSVPWKKSSVSPQQNWERVCELLESVVPKTTQGPGEEAWQQAVAGIHPAMGRQQETQVRSFQHVRWQTCEHRLRRRLVYQQPSPSVIVVEEPSDDLPSGGIGSNPRSILRQC